jgi:hypothetical protein
MSVLLAPLDLHLLSNMTDSIIGSCALVFTKSSLHCVGVISILVEVAKV